MTLSISIPLTLHSRLCTICQNSCESPFGASWSPLTNKRITLCTKKCFEVHSSLKGYNFKSESILAEIKKQQELIKE